MQSGLRSLDASAAGAARLNTDRPSGSVEGLVNQGESVSTSLAGVASDQLEARLLVQSSAHIIEAASENLGTLIDMTV